MSVEPKFLDDREQIERLLPWYSPEPKGAYDSDGPMAERWAGTVLGINFELELVPDPFSMRDRYKVICATCGRIVHVATTGPSIRIADHILDIHQVEAT